MGRGTVRAGSAWLAGLAVLSAMVATVITASPAGAAVTLPAGLNFGLGNDPGDLGWMTSSGVPWRYRYAYLSGGVNTTSGWETWNSPPGQYAAYYMSASAAHGYIPVFSYYELLQSNPSVGANESDRDFSNLNNAATMNAYYANFVLLMQTAHTFGGQVIVQIEPDLWGYLEQRANNGSPASLTASVASSGYAGVAGIPDTAQGFGDALLHLRDVYAPNVALGIHASLWATKRDLATDTDPTLDPNVVADQTAAFLNAAGVGSNAYGSTFDLVFNDVADHDAAWYGDNSHWWDRTNVSLPNFARWVTYMARLHADTGRPLIVWQVPLGNQFFLTMNNTDGHYQDNRAEYFLGHTADLAAAGIAAVLFGKANGGQTNYTDNRADGITDNGGRPTSGFECSACNVHVSQYPDDDGGYLRLAVGAYYASPPAPVSGPGGAYHPVVPARILDTRTTLGGHPSQLCAGQTLTLQVAGVGGAPSGAYAAVMNFTVTNTTASPSYLTVYPADAAQPLASSLNWTIGQTIANLVEVRLSASGAVNVFDAYGHADVVADLMGWVSAPTATPGAAGLFNAVVPARLLDTRDGTGAPKAPVAGGSTISLQVTGRGGIPSSGVAAVVLNLTATNVSGPTYITAWPEGATQPTASNLNPAAGQTIANRVIVKVGSGGRVDLFNPAGSVDLVADVSGWFTDGSVSTSGSTFVGLTPSRILDTRDGTGGLGSSLWPGRPVAVQVAGRGGMPAMTASTPPKAVVINVTITGATAGSYVTVWPDGAAQPLASDLNWVAGQTIPNLVVVGLGSDGKVEIYSPYGYTDVVFDVVGYYQ
jgi:hypothetical protein